MNQSDVAQWRTQGWNKDPKDPEALHKLIPTGHTVILSPGKGGKTTTKLNEFFREDLLSFYKQKYGRIIVVSKQCGLNSRNKFWRKLRKIHGENGFFEWHTSMTVGQWQDDICNAGASRIRYIYLDDFDEKRKLFNYIGDRISDCRHPQNEFADICMVATKWTLMVPTGMRSQMEYLQTMRRTFKSQSLCEELMERKSATLIHRHWKYKEFKAFLHKPFVLHDRKEKREDNPIKGFVMWNVEQDKHYLNYTAEYNTDDVTSLPSRLPQRYQFPIWDKERLWDYIRRVHGCDEDDEREDNEEDDIAFDLFADDDEFADEGAGFDDAASVPADDDGFGAGLFFLKQFGLVYDFHTNQSATPSAYNCTHTCKGYNMRRN